MEFHMLCMCAYYYQCTQVHVDMDADMGACCKVGVCSSVNIGTKS